MTASWNLGIFAHGRSGDKGNHANIAIIAYTKTGYDWIRGQLTAEVVQQYFKSLNPSRVERYEAANILGLNFVLFDVLAGGASRSLRVDTQGKTLALSLLQISFPMPDVTAGMPNFMDMVRVHPKFGPIGSSVGEHHE